LRHAENKKGRLMLYQVTFLILIGQSLKIDQMLAVRTGLEPATPCVTGRYSNQLNYRTKNSSNFDLQKKRRSNQKNCLIDGGPDGTRTRDPLRDRQVF
jgi:hypothetical protein